MNLKSVLIQLLQKFNLRMIKLTKEEYGVSMEYDLIKLFNILRQKSKEIIIFDVGANVGQSIHKFKKICPESQIHSFEPSKECYEQLQKNTASFPNIFYNNIGLGAEIKTIEFYENEVTDINSFLKPTAALWGKIKKVDQMEITTLNDYFRLNQVERINYLKIDTQGYDLEVLKGADILLKNNVIDIIQMEITIQKLYTDLPQMDVVLKYLCDAGYKLVAFYGFHNSHLEARWTDGLFISPQFAGYTNSTQFIFRPPDNI